MDWRLTMLMLLLAALLWWASFHATRKMRLHNKARKQEARRKLDAQARQEAWASSQARDRADRQSEIQIKQEDH